MPLFTKFRNVMLVDDDPLNNLISSKFIKFSGLSSNVVSFLNGISGYKYLTHCKTKEVNSGTFPDLIIVDIDMPAMDGFSFVEKYQEKFWNGNQSTKIVFLTSSQNENHRIKAREYKCISDFLEKPLSIESLYAL